MRAIWEFPLEIRTRQIVMLPAGAKILSVQWQSGLLCFWALVDPNANKLSRCIEIFGTGHEVGEALRIYLGTAQAGPLVWHVFERVNAKETGTHEDV